MGPQAEFAARGQRFFIVNEATGEQTDITGYIQVPDNEPVGPDLGPCCGYWCLNCPYMDEDEDVRSITDREEHNDDE